jgi:hypothetical protein
MDTHQQAHDRRAAGCVQVRAATACTPRCRAPAGNGRDTRRQSLGGIQAQQGSRLDSPSRGDRRRSPQPGEISRRCRPPGSTREIKNSKLTSSYKAKRLPVPFPTRGPCETIAASPEHFDTRGRDLHGRTVASRPDRRITRSSRRPVRSPSVTRASNPAWRLPIRSGCQRTRSGYCGCQI